jgi:hypothetical protein
MVQYCVLASEGRQRYSVYTKTPKNILEKKDFPLRDIIELSKRSGKILLVIRQMAGLRLFGI